MTSTTNSSIIAPPTCTSAPPASASRSQSCRYKAPQWEAQKSRIECLYIKEKRPLKDVRQILEDDCDFIVSEKQLKTRINKWEFDVKNVKGDTMIQLARTQAKRKLLDQKESAFRLKDPNRKPVDRQKIRRYLRRNNISEDQLLSMASPPDASSPTYSVYTPRPPSPEPDTFTSATQDVLETFQESDTVFQIQLQSSETINYDPLAGNSSTNRVALRHVHGKCITPWPAAVDSRQVGALSQTPANYQALNLKWSLVGGNGGFGGILVGPESEAFGVLSVGNERMDSPWQTLLSPMAQGSPALQNAIALMTILQLADSSPSLERQVEIYRTTSMSFLLKELEDPGMQLEACLTTELLLAISSSWTHRQHKTVVSHLERAGGMLGFALLQHESSDGASVDLERLKFLASAWVYLDTMSRLTTLQPFSRLFHLDAPSLIRHVFGNQNDKLDPLTGCIRTLFPLMVETAEICRQTRIGATLPLAMIDRARELHFEIELWNPDITLPFPDGVPWTKLLEALNTAEAYRFATLLYLHQAISLPFSLSSHTRAQSVLLHLEDVPLESKFIAVHLYPLLAGGSEARDSHRREWVCKRWQGMSRRMRTSKVDDCWTITQEVWRRRDNFQLVNGMPGSTASLDKENRYPEEMEREMGVKGRLHWAGVMIEWGWELLF